MQNESPPERGEWMRRATVATVALLLERMLGDLSGTSTDPQPATERLMMAAVRPWLPKLRDVLLSRLSAADPVGLEHLMSATSSALGDVIAQAPGVPEPPYVFGRTATGYELRPATEDDHDG